MTRFHSQNGFTLLELLIAVAIFALLSAGCYRIFRAVTGTSEVTTAIWEGTGELQKALLIIQKDFQQLAIRPVRNEFGDQEPAFRADNGQIRFTRHGWRNFTGAPRSDLQRVRYLFDGGRLLRHYWQTLDRAPDTPHQEQVVLDNLQNFSVKFRDDKKRWHSSWPPASDKQSERLKILPSAVEVTLIHDRLGQQQLLIPGMIYKHQEKKAENKKAQGGQRNGGSGPPSESEEEEVP